jgi:crotonobetainyl-CoA:carnitine CoA-transferase CaiB-like acyl-CoA transferase
MPQPLSGMKIADFSHVMAGPFCSHFLRLLGAEVIKVESFAGDALRNYGPFREYDGIAPAFIAANVGKKSIAVDLKSAGGHEIACRLIGESDVVLENFRPGVMSRLGLDYETCKRLRPGIVWCSVSGYGQKGALRDSPAIDNIVQATSGMMAANGGPDDPPSRVGWPVVDTYTGTLAALAVLSALLQRARFGEGQYIDVAMLDASIVMLTSLATPYLVSGQLLPRTGDTGYSGSPTAGMFVARDGVRISLGAVQNNQFRSLCRIIGHPELILDPRFAAPETRIRPENAEPLRTLLTQVFATRDGADWEATLSAGSVPCGLVRNIGEVCDQLRQSDRGLVQPTVVPGVTPSGATAPAYVNAGFLFEHDGPGVAGAAPLLGEHTREVLQSLGYDERGIEALSASRSVLIRNATLAGAS